MDTVHEPKYEMPSGPGRGCEPTGAAHLSVGGRRGSKRNQRAIVLGGSIAGLLAARALSEHAEEVIVIERDALPAGESDRKGVPQGRHAHGLLARGQAIFESFFPGLGAELAEAGAMFGDIGEQIWVLGGRRLHLPRSTGRRGFTCARSLLEGRVRARVRALDNVQLRDRTDVLELVADGDRIGGVRVLPRADASAPEVLQADLVVDASGRGSKLPSWLDTLGYAPPEEQRVRVDVGYSTVLARRHPRHAGGSRCVVVAAAPPNRRCGVALAIDAERWIVTLPGYLGESAGRTWSDLVQFARGLPSPDLFELLSDSEALSDVATAKFPHSQWRRYDRMRRHPDGVVAFGDALCSFNPIFGQGMSVAACEAVALTEALARYPLRNVWRSFYRDAQKVIEVPWSMAVGNDLRYAEVEGRRTVGGRLLARYLDRLFRVAASDAQVGARFLEVTHLLKPPQQLMSPSVLWRVLRGGRRETLGPMLPVAVPPR